MPSIYLQIPTLVAGSYVRFQAAFLNFFEKLPSCLFLGTNAKTTTTIPLLPSKCEYRLELSIY